GAALGPGLLVSVLLLASLTSTPSIARASPEEGIGQDRVTEAHIREGRVSANEEHASADGHASEDRHPSDDYVLPLPYRSQLDGSPYAGANCGPTALSMVLAYYGIDASL